MWSFDSPVVWIVMGALLVLLVFMDCDRLAVARGSLAKGPADPAEGEGE